MNENDDVEVFRQWMIPHTSNARRYGMSVRELAQERQVVEKTIPPRDLGLLQQLGFFLVATTAERSRKIWKAAKTDGYPPLRFTQEDAVARWLALPPVGPQSDWLSAPSGAQIIYDLTPADRFGRTCRQSWGPPAAQSGSPHAVRIGIWAADAPIQLTQPL